MGHEDDAKAILAADVTLAALLTGGIYTWDETGRQGLARSSTPAAWDGATLLPAAVVKVRSQVPDEQIVDAGAQASSYRQVLEVWVYQDGDAASDDVIESALARAYALLHAQAIGDAQALWAQDMRHLRDEALEDAHVGRGDYALHGVRTV